jgi:hypothetical protein
MTIFLAKCLRVAHDMNPDDFRVFDVFTYVAPTATPPSS